MEPIKHNPPGSVSALCWYIIFTGAEHKSWNEFASYWNIFWLAKEGHIIHYKAIFEEMGQPSCANATQTCNTASSGRGSSKLNAFLVSQVKRHSTQTAWKPQSFNKPSSAYHWWPTVFKTHPNWTPMGYLQYSRSHTLDSALCCYHQSTIFRSNVVHPWSGAQRLYDKESMQVFWSNLNNNLRTHFMLASPLICQPSVPHPLKSLFQVQAFSWTCQNTKGQ